MRRTACPVAITVAAASVAVWAAVPDDRAVCRLPCEVACSPDARLHAAESGASSVAEANAAGGKVQPGPLLGAPGFYPTPERSVGFRGDRTGQFPGATPRVWLEQGKRIAVKNAPTHFGTMAYQIVSDADHGKISATIEMPSRQAPRDVALRFRHPTAAPIKGVTINGKPWTEFNKDKETITLKGLTGTVAVRAQY
jgi:hypothetical protein